MIDAEMAAMVNVAADLMMAPGLDAVRFYRRILDCLADGVYFVNLERRITYWNGGAERLTGYRAEEVVGRFCRDNLLVHTDAEGCQLCLRGCPLSATFADGQNRDADVFMKHKEGYRVPVTVRVSPILDEEGIVFGGVEVFGENSAKLAAIEKAMAMERMALIDPLTGVGNRRYTERVLRERDAQMRQDGEAYAVLFVDIDRFKRINDAYGHACGDAVLRAVAQTLVRNLRSFDFLGRWGGEEFVAVLSRADAGSARAVAARCRALVGACAVDYQGETIRPTISIGVALARADEEPAAVVARADGLLYKAKQAGRDCVMGP